MGRKTPQGRDARSQTITISVTPRIKLALDRAVDERQSDGQTWSVNREAWERLRYTFELTGEGDEENAPKEIELFANELAAGKVKREADSAMRWAIIGESKAPPFSSPTLLTKGAPRSRRAAGDGVNVLAGILQAAPMNALADAVADDPYIPTDDLDSLRSENRTNLDSLTVETDANVSDDDLRVLQDIWSPDAVPVLRRLCAELIERTPDASEYDALPLPRQRRLATRLQAEYKCLRELEAVRLLARYASAWLTILDGAIEDFINAAPDGLPDDNAISSLALSLAKVPAKQLDQAYEEFRLGVAQAQEGSLQVLNKISAMFGIDPIE